ncbi:uncharacterized protein C18orf63 [Hippoglossus stenolepis]|uniref:uncharacterized protein C18orf63 n=1 Tax=Hippoglossus stenolepis TaxID=195615 RepID=UPI001FAF0B45|nr:uncharacterized protein C18orf63 [Hippoglossus stenolepis]
MSGVQQSLFFLGLPDLKNLVCVTLTLFDEEPRSKQIKTCRELVLLYSDILASPALDSFTDITVVMAITFFQKGVLQAFGQRRGLQLGSPQGVFPGDLQCCLSYSLITRLSPSWNKAGLYLVSGKDFLRERGTQSAVSMELSTTEGQLCISINTHSVRLSPTTLEDFDLPPLVLRRFCSDPDSILDPSSTGGTVWCHVLPSMKKGQIITISHQLPRDGPFRTYTDLQNHWNSLYGYRLPELTEAEVVYCSVYFRLLGETLFTYPLSCIRLQPAQCCPRGDLQGALGSFLSDVRDRVQSVCGFPARLTRKPCYHTTSLNSAASAQVQSSEQVNLTTSSSVRPVLTQLPAPPPRPVRPSFRSQPAAWPPRSQQDRLLPSPLPSSSSIQLFQPASSLSSSSSCSTSSSVLPPLPPSMSPAPKLVPIFKNKHPSRHINVALLWAQKQTEQLGGGGEERRRLTLPAFRKNSPASAPPSSSFPSLPVPPPIIIPRFNCRPKPTSSTAPQSSATPRVRHLSSLSPGPKSRPGLVLAPNTETKHKSKSSSETHLKAGSENSPAAQNSRQLQEEATTPPSAAEAPPSLTTSDMSDKDKNSRARVRCEAKPKKSRAAIRDVDVEKLARSNQLSKLNSATLLSWLKGRGVLASARLKKEELMLKVMGCLAEA